MEAAGSSETLVHM